MASSCPAPPRPCAPGPPASDGQRLLYHPEHIVRLLGLRQQQAVLSIAHEVRRAVVHGNEARQTRGHALQHRVRARVIERRMDEPVRRLIEQSDVRLRRDGAHAIGQPELRHAEAVGEVQRRSDDPQVRIHLAPHVEQHVEPLAAVVQRDEEEDRPCRVGLELVANLGREACPVVRRQKSLGVHRRVDHPEQRLVRAVGRMQLLRHLRGVHHKQLRSVPRVKLALQVAAPAGSSATSVSRAAAASNRPHGTLRPPDAGHASSSARSRSSHPPAALAPRCAAARSNCHMRNSDDPFTSGT